MKNSFLRRVFFFLLLFCTLAPTLKAAVGDWTNYLSYRTATQCVAGGKTVFVNFDGNLLSYNASDEEVHLYSKASGLSDATVQLMAYSETAKSLVVVYANANIDLLDPQDGSVVNIPQLSLESTRTGSPVSLSVTGSTATLATTTGIALIDLESGQLQTFYPQSVAPRAAAVFAKRLFVANSAGLHVGLLSENLYDTSSWNTVSSVVANDMQVFADGLYVASGAGLIRYEVAEEEVGFTSSTLSSHVFTSLSAVPSALAALGNGRVATVAASSPNALQLNAAVPDASWTSVAPMQQSELWVCRGRQGVQAYAIDGQQITEKSASLGTYGSQTDLCGFLRMVGDRLLICGGRMVYNDRILYAPTALYYENNGWNIFQTDGVVQASNIGNYANLMSMAQDPADANHHFVASGNYGLFEFRNGKFEKCYSLDNSTLRAFYGESRNSVRVDGLAYDDQGNLWMANQLVDTTICVRKADGSWSKILVDAVRKARHLQNFLFDTKGRLWATNRSWAGDVRGGVLCLDFGGTIDDTDDDVATFRYAARNEDGAAVSFQDGAYCIVQDQDGAIWLGAQSGVYVIDDPDSFSSSDFTVTQVKVPRNDDTNYADYLLDGIPTTAIAIDGANRKWIGTSGSGLYLVSASGEEILQHFTASNSPLPSDVVLGLAVSRQGEVFVGTDKGLVSYQSEAGEPAATLSSSLVKVYPNPVRPDYHGNVTISGLTAGADVKIVTTSGRAVASGIATGGSYSWNVCDFNGHKVSTGIYYVLLATEDGSKGIAAKIAVVR